MNHFHIQSSSLAKMKRVKISIREKYMLYYERKENHVLVMAFAQCVRGIVHCYNKNSRTRTFLFYLELEGVKVKKLAFLSIIIGSLLVIIGTSCQRRTIQKNQEIISEMEQEKPVKKTFKISIPAAADRGTIIVQEPDGDVLFSYKGTIDIQNDGRNGQAIDIVVTVPEENNSIKHEEVQIDE